jgi:hypothetical protein
MTTTPIDLTPPVAPPMSGLPTSTPAPKPTVAPGPQGMVTLVPSAWDHAALVLGSLVLVGAAVVDSFHSLSGTDWAAIAAGAASLGVKGFTGIRSAS